MTDMRHFLMRTTNEQGTPYLTLFELNKTGRILRSAQIFPDSAPRFSPEDIFYCHSLRPDLFASQPPVTEIDNLEFEMMWEQVQEGRNFRHRLPDQNKAWVGEMVTDEGKLFLYWDPDCEAPRDPLWEQVPGFRRLWAFTHGGKDIWKVPKRIFLAHPTEWKTPVTTSV